MSATKTEAWDFYKSRDERNRLLKEDLVAHNRKAVFEHLVALGAYATVKFDGSDEYDGRSCDGILRVDVYDREGLDVRLPTVLPTMIRRFCNPGYYMDLEIVEEIVDLTVALDILSGQILEQVDVNWLTDDESGFGQVIFTRNPEPSIRVDFNKREMTSRFSEHSF